jgi:hypothetical protein
LRSREPLCALRIVCGARPPSERRRVGGRGRVEEADPEVEARVFG